MSRARDPNADSTGRWRRVAASWPIVAAVASPALLGLLAMGLGDRPGGAGGGGTPADRPLVVFCAASNRGVMEAVRRDYEREAGVRVQVQYGSSQSLLASLGVTRAGDLYLPADRGFLDLARERRLVGDEVPLADMRAVVAVRRGNPPGIRGLDDLLRGDVRVAQGDAEATAIGKLTRSVLGASGRWEALRRHTTATKATVHEVANDVKIGAVDAGIVFDAVLRDYGDLEAVAIPELAPVRSRVAVAVLESSEDPRRAWHFARFLGARDRGLARYRERGFEPVEGDAWADRPELTLYAGSMLRPAIEATIAAFEGREGVRVTRVYNGCGILVAQMKAGRVPDAYFACDAEFMGQVKDLFPESHPVSQNELVILVKKGNPLGIGSLKDLARPGLRVGIGHEKQCAMGWITQRTFAESGLRAELMGNVAVQTPTGDMLVNQMRGGSLDAAVAYLSNAAGASGSLDAIRIRGVACSVATQPFGVAGRSDRRQLGGRLLRAIRSGPSREKFAGEGFRWLDDRRAAHD